MVTNCYCHLKDKSKFNKWIVEQLGPVLLGAKPAEILSFPTNNSLSGCRNLVENLFKGHKQIGFKVIHPPKGCMKILFYNNKILDETLQDSRNLRFLKRLGYNENYSLDFYLKALITKLNKGEMPPEIGVFLGYPLKDVIGFIGHPSLKLTEVNRWRVYGNPRTSNKIRQKIMAAKTKIKRHLEENEPNIIVASVSSEDFINEYATNEYHLALLCYLNLKSIKIE